MKDKNTLKRVFLLFFYGIPVSNKIELFNIINENTIDFLKYLNREVEL